MGWIFKDILSKHKQIQMESNQIHRLGRQVRSRRRLQVAATMRLVGSRCPPGSSMSRRRLRIMSLADSKPLRLEALCLVFTLISNRFFHYKWQALSQTIVCACLQGPGRVHLPTICDNHQIRGVFTQTLSRFLG